MTPGGNAVRIRVSELLPSMHNTIILDCLCEYWKKYIMS